jgi:hypothetical protein
MKPVLYLETTIPSYLVSRPSRDVVVAARQEITRQWWDIRRADFRIVASQVVLDEAAEGDREAARNRLAVLEAFPLLAINDEVVALAEGILRSKVLPRKAARDAAHIAVSAVHAVGFLLTWNCVHLANAETFPLVEKICSSAGYNCPVICTPDELLGGEQ